jgi:hypothetical protein
MGSVAYMKSKPLKITAFVCVNLLAAYVPAPLFLRDILWWSDSPKEAFLDSPVAFACRVVESRYPRTLMPVERKLYIGRSLLVAFLLLLFVASAAFYNSRKAWVAMPSIVLVYPLLQGLTAAFINGLNALPGP